MDSLEGDEDLDSARDKDPLSEIASLQRLRDPPELLSNFPSDGLLNFLLSASRIVSSLVFFFASFDDDFRHHEGIVLFSIYSARPTNRKIPVTIPSLVYYITNLS